MEEKKPLWTFKKHALITGASNGMGRELALRLVGVCRRLTLVARNRDGKLDELARQLRTRATNGNIQTEVATASLDICDREGAACLLRKIYEQEKDPVEIFINCAGGTHVYDTFESMSPEDIERIFDTNAKAPIFWLRELLPRMKRDSLEPGNPKRGHVLMLSSRSGERTLPNLSVYTAAKGAVEKLVEALQKEYAQYRIVFTLVNPGSINTAFTANWSEKTRAAHNEESMTVEEAVLPVLHALNASFAINRISYESLQQWLNEPGVLIDRPQRVKRRAPAMK